MAIVTTHIREMLQQAMTLASAAEHETLETRAEAQLDAAAVLARHAAAELDDERLRSAWGIDVYTMLLQK